MWQNLIKFLLNMRKMTVERFKCLQVLRGTFFAQGVLKSKTINNSRDQNFISGVSLKHILSRYQNYAACQEITT